MRRPRLGRISAGHTSDSLMIGEQKTTDEAKITQEHGFFAQPTKIVIDASKGDDMINIHTNQERFVFFVSNAPILDTKTLQAALVGGYKLLPQFWAADLLSLF